MMAKDPDERPKHCDDVRQSLQSVLQNLSAKASAPSFARFTENATKYFELDVKKSEEQWQQLKQVTWMNKPLTIVLGLSFICIVALVIWLTQDDGASPEPLQPTLPSQAILNKAHVEPVPMPIKQEPAQQPPQEDNVSLPEKETKQVVKESKKEVLKPTAKVEPVNQEKPAKKIIHKPKPVVKKKQKKQPIQAVEKDILDRVAYKVRRLNGEKVDVLQAHEFHGASHRYFENLSVTKKKTFFTSFKKGGVRLYFYEAVHLKAIVIEKATVHGALFEGNQIKVEVQDEHFKWHTLLNLSKHDISKPMRIAESALPSLVKSVRIRLTSSGGTFPVSVAFPLRRWGKRN